MRMRKTKQQLEKITKYSIRKLTIGVGPVAIGAFLFGASTISVDKVQANEVGGAHSVHYRYLAEQELTESEKALIHHEVPTEFQDDDILYVVYRKKATTSQQLPYTGSKELALTGLGLATASLAVFLVSKKGRKEVLGVLLIGSLGASTFVPYGTFAFENKELLSYNQTISASTHEGLAEGIIHIDGYEYIGYFKEAELHPSRSVSAEKPQLPVEKQSSKEIEKTEVAQERPAVTPEPVVEKPVVENPVAPAVEEKPVSEKPQTRQEENLVEIPFETVTSPDTNLAEGQTRIVTAGVNGQRRLVTKVSMVDGQEVREVVEDQVVQNPVSQVVTVGTKKAVELSPVPEVEPSNQAAKGTQEPGKENQALVQPELPEYHEAKGVQEVNEGEKQGEALVQPVLPEYQEAKGTQEEDKKGQSLTQTELPDYHEAKGAQEVKEGEKQGEALVQPVQEYRITEETTENDVDFNTEEVLDSTKYVGDDTVTREGVKGVQQTTTVKSGENNEVLATTTEVKTPPVSKVVTKGTKPVEGTVDETEEVEIPFKTKTQEDDTLKRGTEEVAQQGVNGKKQITKTYKTIRGEKTNDAPRVVEKVIQEPQDKIIKQGTKGLEKPTLQWANTEKDVLKKSATASYTLTKPAGVEIKSIKLALKDKDGQLVKEVTVAENNLNATLDKLKYYQGYTLSTTMVYDRGEGEETEKLEDKQIQLDLKKVEIKNTRRTDLIKYENGAEANESALKAVPTDLSNYYLKFTSDSDKTTLLAVKNVEETTVNGIPVYKVTAVADNLVDRGTDSTFTNEYIHYIEKPKAHVDNVYYDFKELVDAIQTNPAGEYRIGQTINARNVTPNGNSYVTSEFTGKLLSVDGKHYSISNLEHPLFDTIKNGAVKNISFENVDINVPTQDNVSTIAKVIKGTTTIENVKVTGRIIGRNNVSGFVNNLEENTKIENVAFIGKLHSTGANNQIAGIALRNYRGIVKRAYADADITGNRLRGSMLVPTIDYGMIGDHLIGQKGSLTQSVAKGTLNITNPIGAGAISSKTWPYGTVRDNVSYAKVVHGEMLFGTDDIQNEDAHPQINQLYSVAGFSEGKKSFLQYPKKQVELTKEEADAKVASYNITAVTQESELNPVDALNHEKSYANIQDYKADYAKAYANLDKFMPFYNKEYIVHQANTLAKDHALNTKDVLSVTPMKDHKFITNLDEANKIIVHYSDGTKEYMSLSASSEGLSNVKEYTVTDLGIKFTPNIVQKDHSTLIDGILAKLSPIELQSDPIYQHLGRTGNNKVNAIKDLYLEESFQEVKDQLTAFVTKLVQNEDHQLNDSAAGRQYILDKVEKNKAALLLGMVYLNRYYGVNFDDINIKELMLFKPDFYGKNVSALDFLIKVGSKENNIKGNRTLEAYRETIGGTIGIGELNSFLNYNMRLFTEDTDINVWYKKAVSHTNYVVEKQSSNPDFANKKYRLYENLNNGEHGRYILPLLNTKKAHMFLISTYNTLAFSAFEKYGKNTEAEREAFKKEIDLRAQEQINYLDFWSRLAADNVRNQLLKSENMVPSAIWDNQEVPGHGWADRMGHNKNGDYAPVREFYGPTGKWHGYNGMGAYAYIFERPQNSEAVYYIISSMISDFGTSAFTHETTHINDRMAYLGGWGHREGTDVEAFAQGMLQSPSVSNPNGEYGALGLNMAYERQNDGKQWYNYNPNMLDSRAKIDHYMKNYNEALMMLDHLEADAVIAKNEGTNDKWFKKMDKEWRSNADRNNLKGEPHQWDKLRDLNDAEKAEKITSIDQLVDNNFVTKHGMPGNGRYRAEGFDTAYQTVNMMAGIYGGNTSQSAVGSISFKHNTFRMWGYFGYLDGFVGYASNKYKQEAQKAGRPGLGDDFIIEKVSGGKFHTLEEWKKEWFKEVKAKGEKGFVEIEIDGEKISNYAGLQELFNKAVENDLKAGNSNQTVALKEKVYKQLLQKSDGFAGNLFKA